MPTNELPPEKRIADQLDLPETPPVFPEEVLNSPLHRTRVEPPSTRLLLEGFDRPEITVEFLTDIHDIADGHGLPLDGISVRRDWSDL